MMQQMFLSPAKQIQRMEKLLLESREQSLLDKEFCKRLARSFSNYSGRAGKPAVKWTEVQCWFHDRQRSHPLKDASFPNPPKKSSLPEAIPLKEAHEGRQAKAPDMGLAVGYLLDMAVTVGCSRVEVIYSLSKVLGCSLVVSEAEIFTSSCVLVFIVRFFKQIPNVGALWKVSLISAFFDDVILKTEEEVPDLSELEFEARSSDGAWYDVDTFLTHRDLSSGEARGLISAAGAIVAYAKKPVLRPEVLVRFVGFDAEGDEWVKVKTNIRERSIPLEDSECGKVKVGDLIVCFQEMGDEARYYDAHVIEIQKRMHDIRGCRCLFSIQYDHDNTKARKGSFDEIMLPADILDFSQEWKGLRQRFAKESCGIVKSFLLGFPALLVYNSWKRLRIPLRRRSKNEESAPSK
ncbi:hypothetical protein RHSIM_Rhsim02G0175800 [Rhododendron simsii]|uniref:SAWADEE domain-containing protein n=1 Tax=Rhododendron simsii TaxID=118357 RepID=A0A834LVW8_RHOSS|nr:hypothetical protein RHSIM_Rhsim02G0175800 [Rhododendron simsii]